MSADDRDRAGEAAQGHVRGTQLILMLIAMLVLLRLVAMAALPLMDTTEARYADIARRMVELGDWVTPWHDTGVPFWGKPPLSFWLTAGSFSLFGLTEFAARLPHLLCAAAITGLAWHLGRLRHPREGLLAAALLAGSIGMFLGGSAVMTDPALVLGITLAMHGFWLALHAPSQAERRRSGWTFFVGLAIGLLAKGPIALVLVAVPLSLWAAISHQVRQSWRALPWLGGLVLVALLVAPWYLLAEQRTPGFLRYFLLGEHWHRFVTPGWAGDLYGFAHRQTPGTIWLYAVLAMLPWTLLLPLALRRSRAQPAVARDEAAWRRYLLLWMLWPLIFFTASRNIIWAYVLPSLPAAALLAAAWLQCRSTPARAQAWVAGGVVLTGVTSAVALAVGLGNGGFEQASARPVVRAYERLRAPGEPLLFVGRRPFSASFYGAGAPVQLPEPKAAARRLGVGGGFVAMRPGAEADQARQSLGEREVKPAGRFGAYELLFVLPVTPAGSSQAATEPRVANGKAQRP